MKFKGSNTKIKTGNGEIIFVGNWGMSNMPKYNDLDDAIAASRAGDTIFIPPERPAIIKDIMPPVDFKKFIEEIVNLSSQRVRERNQKEVINDMPTYIMPTHVKTVDGIEIDISDLGLNLFDAKIRKELKRFTEMTERQLWTRLGKINTQEKLINYSKMADKFNYPDLADAARSRCKRLFGYSPKAKKTTPDLKTKNGERLSRKIDQ